MPEIRHYLSPSGKDIFDDWLTHLADARAQAKIAVRINRLAVGNFGDCKSLGRSLYELRIDWGPGYRVYLASSAKTPSCCFAAVTSASSPRISREPRHILKVTKPGVEPRETQNQYFSR